MLHKPEVKGEVKSILVEAVILCIPLLGSLDLSSLQRQSRPVHLVMGRFEYALSLTGQKGKLKHLLKRNVTDSRLEYALSIQMLICHRNNIMFVICLTC